MSLELAKENPHDGHCRKRRVFIDARASHLLVHRNRRVTLEAQVQLIENAGWDTSQYRTSGVKNHEKRRI